MTSKTTVNNRGVAHSKSDGSSVVFPDVCKTPGPGGPVPIPYPNTGKSSDASGGPRSVVVDGGMPMVKGAKYRRTSGDEAGSAGGVLSGTTASDAEFVTYSFDVTFEGRPACRLGDAMFHNRKNTAG